MDSANMKVDDVYIAVMGKTGVGKSTFASRCVGSEENTVGKGLESFTKRAMIHTMQHRDRTLHLIDTPGFGDTYRSDEDIFLEIAYVLIKAYELGIRISGIVFIQPMTENRIQGSTRRILEMLRGLCGEASYPCIYLAASQTNLVAPARLEQNLEELRNEPAFWKSFSDGGSTVIKLDDSRESALAALDTVLQGGKTYVLQFQREVVDEGKRIPETAAGAVIFSEISREIEKLRTELADSKDELERARQQSRHRETDELQESVQAAQDAIDDQKKRLSALEFKPKELKDDWDARYKADQRHITEKMGKLDSSIQALSAGLQDDTNNRQGQPPPYDAVISQLKSLQDEREALAKFEHLQLSRKTLQVSKSALVAGWISAIAGSGSLAVAACSVM